MKSDKNTYRQEHISLDAVQDEDGIYRVPPLPEHQVVTEWKVEWRFIPGAWGIDHAVGKDKTIFHITGV